MSPEKSQTSQKENPNRSLITPKTVITPKMDPKLDDPSSAGGDPEEFTVARKRSRRVSFAETTAVHVFVRDEDFETPPDSNPPIEQSKPENEEEVGLEFRGSGFNGEEDEDDGDEDGEQEKFIRDVDSSSPGSAAASVTSNDDDNFFGPVSTSFIKSGRLSEGGMSDDNDHDITLDSTAFSLHFQKLVPLDDPSANSAGSFRTPTGESLPTASHGFIISKGFMNQAPCSKLSGGKMSRSAGDSGSMSFAVENPDSYDRYAESSPTLDALLAKVDKPMQPNSPFYSGGITASRHDNHGTAVVKESANDDTHICSIDATGKAVDTVVDANIPKGCPLDHDDDQNGIGIPSPNTEANPPLDGPTNEKNQATFPPKSNGYSKAIHEVIQSNPLVKNVRSTHTFSPPNGKSSNNMTSQSGQIHLELFQDQSRGGKYSLDSSPQSMPILPVLVNVDIQQQSLSENGMQTPQNAVLSLQSPLLGSVSSLCSKRQQLYLDPSVLSRNRLMHSLDKDEPLSSLKMKLIPHGERNSAIKIPKCTVHKSPNAIDSRSALSEKGPMPPREIEFIMEENHNGHVIHKGMSTSKVEDSPINVAKEASGCSVGLHLNHSGSPTTNNASVLTNLLKNEAVSGTVKVTTGTSLVQHYRSEINRKENLSTSDNPIERSPILDVHDSSVEKTTAKDSDQILDSLDSIVSSTIQDRLSTDDIVSSNDPSSEGADKLLATVNISKEFLAEATVQSDENMLHSLSPKESVCSKPIEDPIIHDNGLNRKDAQSAQENHSADTELSGKKRGMEQTFLIGEDHFNEVIRMQKSQKILVDTVGSNHINFSEQGLECSKGPVGIREQAPRRHWKNILSKVSKDTEQLFLPSICKLSIPALGILEDILGELQAAGKYERLYTSLRNHNCLGEHQQKRVNEARTLLDELIYKKAKLQLKQMKRDEFSKKAELCRSKIQECAEMKSIYVQSCALNARTFQHRESQCHPGSSNSTTDQVECNIVSSRRHELEMLDQKVKQMIKAFELSCNINGTTSYDGIIELVNNHIEMKNRRRLIQQDLQLWKLSEVVKKNDQLDVVLDYRNVLLQRFTLEGRSVSSMVSNKVLNKESIEKNFPNMNACIAFEFVFKAKEANVLFSSRQLSRETMETSLLLGTLFDVLEEIVVSRLELWNLISSTFHLQSSGRLNLQLSFLHFKSGRKVHVSLDLTTLNCAAYPSDASELKIRILAAESTLPPSMSDKIIGAVEGLENGRSMIVRLCQIISKVIQESDEL